MEHASLPAQPGPTHSAHEGVSFTPAPTLQATYSPDVKFFGIYAIFFIVLPEVNPFAMKQASAAKDTDILPFVANLLAPGRLIPERQNFREGGINYLKFNGYNCILYTVNST